MARKILVADDDIGFAKKYMKRIFPNDEIDFTDNAMEVEELARKGKYDLIITDLQWNNIPDLSPKEQADVGYTIIERIKDCAPRVVLWTGAAEKEGVRERALALGATDVVDKLKLGELAGYTEDSQETPEVSERVLIVYRGSDTMMRAFKRLIRIVYGGQGLTIIPFSKLKTVEGTFRKVGYVSMEGRGGKDSVAHEDKYRETPLGYREVVDIPLHKAVGGIGKLLSD